MSAIDGVMFARSHVSLGAVKAKARKLCEQMNLLGLSKQMAFSLLKKRHEEDDQRALPRKEGCRECSVIRRLQDCSEPILLFGETEPDPGARSGQGHLQRLPGHEGTPGLFKLV
ncbi:hypothetical protein HPB48_017357 [Haemaphysalis longicornis]|uniref:Uncharacterized protein n=1 Tax=Haemaphysalis longicornis TaxID=44386 RepID=A0A9J6GCJ9_HAELO|nr:hypothetical protein HPB48_017357 [Haemaphysalis longicornis]